jgi:hypothetical protein
VEIQYVTELPMEDDKLIFSIPAMNTDRQLSDGALQSSLTSHKVDTQHTNNFSILIGIQSPTNILGVSSMTHPIEIKRTDVHAVIRYQSSQILSSDFGLQIQIENPYNPRIWTEHYINPYNPKLYNLHQAYMVVLYPRFTISDEQGKKLFYVFSRIKYSNGVFQEMRFPFGMVQ